MALRIITHCYSYLRNITHIEEEMSNLWYYAIWLILRIWSIFSQAPQQAHWGVVGAADPTHQGAGWGLQELSWGDGGSLTNVLKVKLSNINLNEWYKY